jgi:hypothetical protein
MRDTTQPTRWERGRPDVEHETKKAMTPGQTLTPDRTAVTAQTRMRISWQPRGPFAEAIGQQGARP